MPDPAGEEGDEGIGINFNPQVNALNIAAGINVLICRGGDCDLLFCFHGPMVAAPMPQPCDRLAQKCSKACAKKVQRIVALDCSEPGCYVLGHESKLADNTGCRPDAKYRPVPG